MRDLYLETSINAVNLGIIPACHGCRILNLVEDILNENDAVEDKDYGDYKEGDYVQEDGDQGSRMV